MSNAREEITFALNKAVTEYKNTLKEYEKSRASGKKVNEDLLNKLKRLQSNVEQLEEQLDSL